MKTLARVNIGFILMVIGGYIVSMDNSHFTVLLIVGGVINSIAIAFYLITMFRKLVGVKGNKKDENISNHS